MSTVDVIKKGETHPVTTTNLHFSMDLTNQNKAKRPVSDNTTEHLGYAFREIALTLKKDQINCFARDLGLREGQIEAIAHRYPDDLIEQKMQIMTTWKNKEGKAANIDKLVTILKHLNPPEKDLCDELQKFIFRPGGTRSLSGLLNDRPLPDLPEANSGVAPKPESKDAHRKKGIHQNKACEGEEINISSVPQEAAGGRPSCKQSDVDLAVTSSCSVRTQYGIPESDTKEATTRKSIEQTTNTNDQSIEEQELMDYAQPVCFCREPMGHRLDQPIGSTIGVYFNLGEFPRFNNNAQVSSYSEGDSNHEEIVSDYDDDDAERAILPGRSTRFEEVIEIRDIREDGEDDDQENSINVSENDKRINEEENTEIMIIADLVLKELNSHMLLKKNLYVCIQKDLDFFNASNTAKGLPRFPNLRSVLLHCGFKQSKKDIGKGLPENIKETINKLDEMYLEANVYISAVLPCRGNKNRENIDRVNAAIEEACAETSAEFVDFTALLIDEETGKLDNSMYCDSVSVNSKGAKKIAKKLQETLGNDLDNDSVRDYGFKTRKVYMEGEKDKEVSKNFDLDISKGEKSSWCTNQSIRSIDFFSGL